jgi:hypothetical protein
MLHHMLRAAAARAFNILDPYFQYVTMLLHGDGSMLGSTTVTPFNADASTNNFNVTINGDARSNNFTPYQAGYYSNYFGGSGNSINYPSASQYAIGTGNFTLEFFVNFSALNAGHNRMFAIGASGTDGLEIDLNGTNLEVGIQNGYPIGYTWVPTVNTWYYMAVTRSGSTVTLYINGTSVATGTSSNNISQNSLSIGGISWQSTWSINGFLSNVRLSNTVRTIATPTTPYTSDANTLFLGAQSNRFLDNSSYVATATATGTPQVSPAQPFTLPTTVATYGSGYFDGTGDYLTAPSNSAFAFGTGDFTVECWAYFTSVANFPTLTDSRATTSSTAGFNLGLSTAKVQLYTTSQVLIGSTTLVANTWYHIAVTRSGTTLKIWLNGVQDATVSNSTNWSDTTLLLGATPTPTNYMTGYMTDTRLVKGTAVYSATFTPPTTPLTAITNTSLLTTQFNGGGNNSGFKDSSQFNFPITRNGNTTQGTFTPYGSNWSNYFTGSGTYLYFANNAALSFGTGDFCVEAYVYKTTAANESIIDSRVTNNATPWALYVDASNFPYFYTGTSYTSTTAIVTNAWNHIAVTRSSGTLKIFVNGVQGYSATVTTNLDRSSGSQVIGADVTGSNSYWSGNISNLRVVKGSAVYTSAFTPSTTPLTAISGTSLLTCQSNRFADASSNAFSLTIVGSPSVQRFSPFSPTTAYSTSVIGGSGYFDGSGDYLTVPTNAAFNIGTNSFTLECWFYSLGSTNYQAIVSAWGTTQSNSAFEIATNGSNLFIQIAYGSSQVSFQPTAPASYQWNHVAMVSNGSTLSAFVNGARIGTQAFSSSINSASFNPAIGYRVAASNYPFLGYIASPRLVNGSAVYDPSSTTITVPTAPLTAITNTSLLLNYTNAAILDNAMMNDLETVGNAQISTSVKKYGTGSIVLDGTGDWLLFPADNRFAFGSGDYTVEAWVYFTSISSSTLQIIFMSGSTGGNNFYCHVDADQISVGTTAAFISNQTSSFSTNTWYHIAFCRSGGTLRLFKDGIQQGSSVTDSTNWISAGSARIGANEAGSQTMFGNIDEIRISKFARYTANFTAPTAAFPNN